MDPNPSSTTSSPRSRPAPDPTWDHPAMHLPPPAAKLRLMCSYGGHIIPRPHDRSLCYVGGHTRILLFDRHSSLSDLHARLSHTLLNGRPCTLKYQLPSEDLDSLISLSTNEDLDNMIDEYDRTSASSLKPPPRLRLFLFPSKPETAASMGALLHDSQSETWFVDVLNGALLDRGLSDSAAAAGDTLVELDRADIGRIEMLNTTDSCISSGLQQPTDQSSSNKLQPDQEVVPDGIANNAAITQEAVVVLDSPPLVENTSSFGSSSSSPLSMPMANLPPIKVRVEDYQTATAALEEQFSSNVNIIAPAPVPKPFEENSNRVAYEDDHGTVGGLGFRKPPLPLQPVQRKLVDLHNLPSPDSKQGGGGYNLPSPDSIASDCSITSGGSLSKNTIYQDNRAPTPAVIDHQKAYGNINQEQTTYACEHMNSAHQYQPMAAVAGGALIHHTVAGGSNAQYIQQHPAAHGVQVPGISSYYPAGTMYLQSNQQQAAGGGGDPQYPPNMYLQQQQQLPPLPQAATNNYNKDPIHHQIYTTTKPLEMAAGSTMQQLVHQVPANHQFHHHQQLQPYIGISHMTTPQPQSNIVAAPYGYDPYSHHRQNMQQHQQQADHLVYYGQQHVTLQQPPPPQYQTMTPAAAAAAAVMLNQQASTHHQFSAPNSDTGSPAASTTAQQ